MIDVRYTWEELRKLPIEERLQLLEAIWRSIEEDSVSTELSEEAKHELERRWAEFQADPTTAIDWEDLRRTLGLAS